MNIPKSPSLQLLRRLHHQPLGFNDVSLSNENDWESESTIIHRHSVSGSSRTSRCSSVLSCALDWEEVDKEISLPNFIEYKTNEKPNWDFTDEMQRFKSLSDDADNEEEEEEEEQQDETIMSEGNLDLEIPKDDEEQTAEEVEAKAEGKEEDDKEENMSPLNRYQRELAKRIFVKNFSDSTSQRKLWQFFARYGKVTRVFIIKDRATRKSRRSGFVQFATMDEAKAVVALDPTKLVLAGRQMYVSAAEEFSRTDRLKSKSQLDIENKIEEVTEEASSSSTEININDLSSEILEHVFSYLNVKDRIRIERVCRRWRQIGLYVPWKITSLNFLLMFSMYNVMTDPILRSVLKRCGKSLKSLNLSDCSMRLSYKALRLIGDYCPNLESVRLGGLPIVNVDLSYFSGKCNKLKEVVIKSSSQQGFGEKGLWYLVKNCDNLEVLEIEDNHRIKGLCFHIISPKIKRLILNNCSKLLPKGIMKLERCKYIENLELNECSSLDTEAMDFLFKHVSGTLKHLSLNGHFPLVRFHELPFHLLKDLEYISVAGNNEIDDSVLTTICRCCLNVRHLNISSANVTFASLCYLNDCWLLTSLNISHIYAVIDELIATIAALGILESLTIQANEKITDDACASLASLCPKLKYLDVSSCTKLTDLTVENFRSAMNLRKKDHQELKIIAGGTYITQFGESEGLTILSVNYCPVHLRPWKEDDFSNYDSDDLDEFNPDSEDLDDDFAERLDLYEGRT